jgi:hypothetical protein
LYCKQNCAFLTGSNNKSLNKILSAMKCDDISTIVQEDQSIKQFGVMQLQRDSKTHAAVDDFMVQNARLRS